SQSPKVKALLSKAFTFGLLKFASLTRTDVKNILMAVTLPISKIILFLSGNGTKKRRLAPLFCLHFGNFEQCLQYRIGI
ncbi:MAG: hypothetical protein ACK48A_09205, partial [Pseudanabaena sp.]